MINFSFKRSALLCDTATELKLLLETLMELLCDYILTELFAI